MLQRVEPQVLQNSSNFKFKKYINTSIDSSPTLIKLRRKITMQENSGSLSALKLRRESALKKSSHSLSKVDCKESDDPNFAFDTNIRENIFPDWLEKQEEFKVMREVKGNYSIHNVFEICQKRVIERTDIDIGHTNEYLKSRVDYFSKNCTKELISQIAAKVLARFVEAGETIFDKGEKGTKMYTIYNGKVKLTQGATQTIVTYNGVFGEKALEQMGTRQDTAVALTNCELIVLTLED